MTKASDAAGAASLAICESLLLSLAERRILDQAEIAGLLEDAASAHRNAAAASESPELHRAAAELIEQIIDRIDPISPG
jgi:hypothetical protein